MLTYLMESVPRRRRVLGIRGAAVSFAVHIGLVYGAVTATSHRGPSSHERPTRITELHFVPDKAKQTEPDIALPDESGWVVPPTVMPTTIMPPDPGQVWDPRVYDRERLDPLIRPSTPENHAQDSLPILESFVDERPEVISPFNPEYPDLLRQAGIEGIVVIEAIVDTMGRAEPASVRVIQSSNRAFEAGARAAVLRTGYRPGKVAGRVVRVLVQVPIAFSIRR